MSTTIARAPERSDGHIAHRSRALETVLLSCGIAYAVLYPFANDVIAAARYPGYSRMSQAVSELSAIGAPTRWFLAATAPVFAALMVAFGIGVRRADASNRRLKLAGTLLTALGAIGLLWLPFPMTGRADMVRGTMAWNDIGHLGMTVVTVAFFLLILGFAAAALGRRFRIYSIVTGVVVMMFGALTGRYAAALNAGHATPYMGLFERINIAAWLIWLIVLAVALLRTEPRAEVGRGLSPPAIPPGTASG